MESSLTWRYLIPLDVLPGNTPPSFQGSLPDSGNVALVAGGSCTSQLGRSGRLRVSLTAAKPSSPCLEPWSVCQRQPSTRGLKGRLHPFCKSACSSSCRTRSLAFKVSGDMGCKKEQRCLIHDDNYIPVAELKV